jgi:hypothetical protein
MSVDLKMGDSDNLLQILREHFGPDGGRMHTAAEIGVHRGALSAKLLAAFPNLTLFMVDSWRATKPGAPYFESGDSCAKLTDNEQHQCKLEAKRVTEFAASRRMIFQAASLTAAKLLPPPRFSWIFVDASHLYEDVRDDIAAWWPRIEGNGILAGHDIFHRRFPGVERAVREFAEREQVEFKTIGSVWYVVKP